MALCRSGPTSFENRLLRAMTVIGYRIHIDGIMRSFRDRQEGALEAAGMTKTNSPRSKVAILDERNDRTIETREDGRTA